MLISSWVNTDNTELTQLKTKTLAYMAGLVDGDGHIGIHKDGGATRVTIYVCNGSKRMMNWIVQHFGGVIRNDKIPSGKPFYRWLLYGKTAQTEFIRNISPYLIVKRSQADVVRQYLDLATKECNPDKRNVLLLETRNQRELSSVETETQNKLESKLLCAYAAGLVDTDGHLGTRRVLSGKQANALRTRIEVVNIYKPVLDDLQKTFGGYVSEKTSTVESPTWHTRYRLIVTDKKAQERMLLAMLPYLTAKRDAALEMLSAIRSSPRLMIQPELTGDRESELVGTPVS